MKEPQVRVLAEDDRHWVEELLTKHWGFPRVVTRGRMHNALELPGFLAEVEEMRVGLVTYHIDGTACEVVTLNSLVEGVGVGTALLEAVREAAVKAGCHRLWLITTNDNLDALRFYQRRGFELVAVHRDLREVARRLKPSIPLVGNFGIPLRDEIELELRLDRS